jgi:hypothetical protein
VGFAGRLPERYSWRYSVATNTWSAIDSPGTLQDNIAIVLLSSGDVALVGDEAHVWIFHP